MATKVYCDRCKREIDIDSRDYRRLYFMSGGDAKIEDYDFCAECFTSIKKSIFNNLLNYKHFTLDDRTDREDQ